MRYDSNSHRTDPPKVQGQNLIDESYDLGWMCNSDNIFLKKIAKKSVPESHKEFTALTRGVLKGV
jgi:hypothetical protein